MTEIFTSPLFIVKYIVVKEIYVSNVSHSVLIVHSDQDDIRFIQP